MKYDSATAGTETEKGPGKPEPLKRIDTTFRVVNDPAFLLVPYFP